MGGEPKIFAAYHTQGAMAALFAFGIYYFMLSFETVWSKHKRSLTGICLVGRASWHIMLVQMVYFYFARSLKFESRFPNLLVVVVVDLLISVIVGLFFYMLDMKVQSVYLVLKKEMGREKYSDFK